MYIHNPWVKVIVGKILRQFIFAWSTQSKKDEDELISVFESSSVGPIVLENTISFESSYNNSNKILLKDRWTLILAVVRGVIPDFFLYQDMYKNMKNKILHIWMVYKMDIN